MYYGKDMAKSTDEKIIWSGPAPAKCDTCQAEIKDEFIDGKTKMGPWANMCKPCHYRYGCGLGTGKGQRYQKQTDGSFLKVEG
jgi:hypothetical protein